MKGDYMYLKEGTNEIGVLRSSKQLGKPKEKKVMSILMTCGGGMGGSSWREIVLKCDIEPNTLQEFFTPKGEKIILNTSFAVTVTNYTLLTIPVHDWLDETDSEYKILIKPDVKWVLTDKVMERDSYDNTYYVKRR